MSIWRAGLRVGLALILLLQFALPGSKKRSRVSSIDGLKVAKRRRRRRARRRGPLHPGHPTGRKRTQDRRTDLSQIPGPV